ncbi:MULTISPECIES: glycosyltransferase family 4 protein [Gordonia]|uniref:Glycosyltransferase family 1 protein n=3 Tax=Gordonia amicalis TaxID=89053 RepID=A0AAE4UBG7_9ACTN|nr:MULTISPECIES: glycosyltransferase family 1 protein [Gordonia]ATD69742.1 glycosyltransferase family 1 protein [Gordonia sp. 1D]KAF0968579.1 GDP-mannose-dependent alpha-mannosyltransferase [Gordonia sp. YY1]MBA5846852.1 glycosyltransferase family 1 protein [Gordonia amicalis]MCZ0911795.1 glycosyltransferase family 1 protein [Gordonia amicalis]MCZ4579310.1 glycosyltransferase family 1 protein [Gordonia amicalis]
MRVAIVAESFLPQMNGVVNSVLRVVEHLESTGHEVVVIAPDTPRRCSSAPRIVGRRTAVHLVPSVRVPRVTSLPVGVPMPLLYRVLRDFGPDVVHLASPFVVGAAGAVAARALGVPVVAVFQTDVAGFAASYRLGAVEKAAWRYTRLLHEMCDLTLAPSSETMTALAVRGVPRLRKWGRGVDLDLFAPDRRDEALRAQWRQDRDHALVCGFVGRLAPEKHVERLAGLSGDPRVRLVIVGDGPERARLERLMPDAVFTGELRGDALARAYASFDVFVHAGEHETFCQTIQEAMASGLPVIAPAAGGPCDLVTPFRTGYLLEVARFEAALPAIVDSLHDDAVRAAFGRAALQAVRSRTWPSVCAELVGHYRSVTGAGAAAEFDRPA